MGKKILLIDDDADLLETYEESLRLSGYDVITSTNPEHGLELYSEFLPCMVFLDIKMPEMSGYDLFSKIKDLDPRAKVVFITGHEDVEQSLIARKKGILDILKKPMIVQEMTNAIKANNC